MDDGEININPEDINRLSDREKRELQIFLQGESQKAQVQKRKHLLVHQRASHQDSMTDLVLGRLQKSTN